jgi:exopolysaccharide biosynthesis polyprenyl glycosylphosphotransferase
MRHLHPVFNLVKRFFDVGVSLTGLVFSLPFAGVIALALKLQDGGPVFYAQTRMGFRGRPFRIFKFRSMTTEAEKNGPQWASKGDVRVTPIGRILRRTRLDELPQFWNILRGEMSFIGPRPERVEFSRDIEREVPFFRLRTLVKPGLTGWAQVNYPYGASVEDARRKLSYDLYYIKYASVFLDLVIILRTFIAMVKGAR